MIATRIVCGNRKAQRIKWHPISIKLVPNTYPTCQFNRHQLVSFSFWETVIVHWDIVAFVSSNDKFWMLSRKQDSKARSSLKYTMNVCFGSIILWYVFIWQNIYPLLQRNTSFTRESYILLLSDHLFQFVYSLYLQNDEEKITYNVIGFNLPEISFYHFVPNKSRGIRKTNDNSENCLKIKYDWKARKREIFSHARIQR